MNIVEATNMDFVRFFKRQPPATPWHGQAMKKGKLVQAIAGLIEVDDGRVFGFMDLSKVARYPMMYRHVRRFLDKLPKNHDITEIFVGCDTAYDRAEEFLARLGFKKTDEFVDGYPVWRYTWPQ